MFQIFKEYRSLLDKFLFKFKAIDFIYSLDTLEQCIILFLEELDIKDTQEIEKNYTYNKMYYTRFCKILDIDNSLESVLYLYCITTHVLAYLYKYQSRLMLCSLAEGTWEPLDDANLRRLRKENKYKFTQRARSLKNGGTFEHYFYELKSLDHKIDNLPVLKMIDSIRKRLTEEGDTTINKKDIIYSINKYYDYMIGGFTIDQS